MIKSTFHSDASFAVFREFLSKGTPFIYIHFKKNPPNSNLICKNNPHFSGGSFAYDTNEKIGDIKNKIIEFTGLEVDFYYQTETDGKLSFNKFKKEFDNQSLISADQYAKQNNAKNIQNWLEGFVKGVVSPAVEKQLPIEIKVDELSLAQERINELNDTGNFDPLYQSKEEEYISIFEQYPALLNDVKNLDIYLWSTYLNKKTKENSLQLLNHWWPKVSEKKKILYTALSIYNSFEKFQEIISIYRSDPAIVAKNDFYFNKIIWALYKNDGTEKEALDLINEKLELLQDTDSANHSIGCVLRYHAKKTKDQEMLERAISYFTLSKSEKEVEKTKSLLEEWKNEAKNKSTDSILDDDIMKAINTYTRLDNNLLDKYWGESYYNKELIDYCDKNPQKLSDNDTMNKYLWCMYEYAINRDEKMMGTCHQKALDYFQKNEPQNKEANFIYACILRSYGWRNKSKESLIKSMALFESAGAYVFKNETEALIIDMDGLGIKWQFFSEMMDEYHDIIKKSRENAYQSYRKEKKQHKLLDAGISDELIDQWQTSKKINLWEVHCSIEASETSIGKLIIPTEGKLLRDGAKDFIKSYWSVLDKYWIKETPLKKAGAVHKVNIVEINEFTY